MSTEKYYVLSPSACNILNYILPDDDILGLSGEMLEMLRSEDTTPQLLIQCDEQDDTVLLKHPDYDRNWWWPAKCIMEVKS